MRDFSRSRVHFSDLEVCCDWSTFFPLKSADVSGEGTRQEPLRTSAWEAIKLLESFDTVNTGLTRTDIYSEFFMNFIPFTKLAKFSIVVRIHIRFIFIFVVRIHIRFETTTYSGRYASNVPSLLQPRVYLHNVS